jgi:electron transport complex protein RnfG
MNGHSHSVTAAPAAEASPLRLVFTLAFAGLMSGLIIVAAYEATLPAITEYKATMLREAVLRVLPGVAKVQRLVFRDGHLTASDEIGRAHV